MDLSDVVSSPAELFVTMCSIWVVHFAWSQGGIIVEGGSGVFCSEAAIATFSDLPPNILFAQSPFCGGITLHQGETKVIRSLILDATTMLCVQCNYKYINDNF